jgi:hypothetical protein
MMAFIVRFLFFAALLCGDPSIYVAGFMVPQPEAMISPRKTSPIGGARRLHSHHHTTPRTTAHSSTSTALAYQATRYDSLVSGIAEISLGASLCVLWSEYSVITTGCGPLDLSDFLERFCYQADITCAGLYLFSRIAFGRNVATILIEEEPFGYPLQGLTLLQVTWAEWLAFGSVVGAFLALSFQVANGAAMDGLTGIDVEICRNMRDFRNL